MKTIEQIIDNIENAKRILEDLKSESWSFETSVRILKIEQEIKVSEWILGEDND